MTSNDPSAPPTKPSILILDDDRDMVDLLCRLFERSGFACEPVHSVTELKALEDALGGFDMAILDLNLGSNEPSGLEALDVLHDHSFEGHVIFLTGHGRQHPLVRAAMDDGQVEVVQKPVQWRELVAIAQSVGASP